MFNVKVPFHIPIFSGRKKMFRLRWPSDAEWIERSKKLRVRRPLQGDGEAESNEHEVNAELLGKLLLEGEQPEFDGAEASAVIGRLLAVRGASVELDVDRARVEMVVVDQRLVHHLLLPTRAQQEDVRKRAVSVSRAGRRAEDLRMPIEPSAALYDSLFLRVEGYEGAETAGAAAVPVVHKDAAMELLFREIRMAEEEPDPED